MKKNVNKKNLNQLKFYKNMIMTINNSKYKYKKLRLRMIIKKILNLKYMCLIYLKSGKKSQNKIK